MKKIIVIFWIAILAVGTGLIIYERDPWGLGRSLRHVTGFVIGWPQNQNSEDKAILPDIKQELLDLVALREDLAKSNGDPGTYIYHLNNLVQQVKDTCCEDVIYQLDAIILKDPPEDADSEHALKPIAMSILVELPLKETEGLLKKMIQDESLTNIDPNANPLRYNNIVLLKRMALKPFGNDPQYLLSLIDTPDAPGMNHDIYLAVIERYVESSEDPSKAIQDLRSRVRPMEQGVLDTYESSRTQ